LFRIDVSSVARNILSAGYTQEAATVEIVERYELNRMYDLKTFSL
jgi:hypothetical protein